ncbi:D-2-hydroxyacid dehydrogenase [Salinirubellus sp. GCM10025818]|uniref:D-2-hydroxyacid dehydrogenase n=1 Tax=Salinirubellus TaxID=2162630 RepID=UPI0030CC19E1
MDVARIGVHESVERVFPPEELREFLDDAGPEVAVVGDPDEVEGCDLLVTLAWDERFLDAGIGWIHSIQAGVDRFPFEDLESNGITLTNSTGIHGESVGETVVGYMLTFARRLHVYLHNQRDHEWTTPAWDEPFTLNGRSVCVVGLGTLGRGIASRASALGMRVTGVKRTVEPVPDVQQVHPQDELLSAVEGVDFVALACPLTEETHHLVDEEVLAAMDDGSYLLNVARGSVIDEDALVEALRGGELAGAALDVFEEEPLPADSPLWDFEEVLVTPHKSGSTWEYYQLVGELVYENLERDERGEELINRVV